MPHQAEGNANNALGNLLRPMLGKTSVFFESTRVITGSSGKRPDILITAPGRSPVVIEAEYDPARTVEPEARERLGMRVENVPRPIEAAVALRYPVGVDDAYDQRAAIADARLSYCVFTVERYSSDTRRAVLSVARFPESGWLDGGVADLADLVRLVSVPQLAVEDAAKSLEDGINRAAAILNDLEGVTPAIARLLGMDNVPQTRRMACAIIANALVFHERIARIHPGIKTLKLVCGPDVSNPQSETLNAWTEILKINYWPIFAIGKDILQQLPAQDAAQILKELEYTAGEVNATGVDNAHDLTGRVFQRLISDRKYLATFYTLPPSAALLARLAVAKMDGVDWSDAEAIGKLRVGDFACGTGALLSAVYEQIAARHEQAYGDPAAIHPAMMEEVLYGCDVMPSAIHITGSTLSGMQPDVGFGKSRLYTMPYGRQQDGSVKIGSLEFLQSSAAWVLFNTSDPALRTGSAGEETAAQLIIDVQDESFDLVIMNPPFTRNTTNEGETAGTYAGAFAAFGNSLSVQEDMANRLGRLIKGTVYHGNAGLGAAFAALADRKLKPGGVLGLVLPLALVSGPAWTKLRKLLSTGYTDLTVVSLSANSTAMAFSADTGMAECLIVARKLWPGEQSSGRALFLSMPRRPNRLSESDAVFKAIQSIGQSRRLEDGPYGGTPVRVGEDISGESLTAPIHKDGEAWGTARLHDIALAQTAYAVSLGRLELPGEQGGRTLPIKPLGEFGKRGLYHLDINGTLPRGPFDLDNPSPTATYPTLWNHHAERETRFVLEPDRQLRVRPGMEAKAEQHWQTISRSHINAEFTFGSQPLAIAFTERETMGGTVWPNVQFDDPRFDYVFAVWGNSTLGLLTYWQHSNRAQSSKARMTVSRIPSLPCLDFRALTDAQLATAESIFNEFRDLDLQPAYLADADPNRALLDRRVVCDLLGFGEDVYRAVRRLAAKWCAEPSVHGGKARPKSAVYVE